MRKKNQISLNDKSFNEKNFSKKQWWVNILEKV